MFFQIGAMYFKICGARGRDKLSLGLFDSIIFHDQDLNGQKWFKIDGSAFSMRGKRKMEDVNGIEICGYQKKLLSMHATAYITIKDQSGSTFVVATIKRVINI